MKLIKIVLGERYEFIYPMFEHEPADRLLLAAAAWVQNNPRAMAVQHLAPPYNWHDYRLVLERGSLSVLASSDNMVLLGAAAEHGGSTTFITPLVHSNHLEAHLIGGAEGESAMIYVLRARPVR